MKVIRVVPFLDFGGVEQRIRLTAKASVKVPNVSLIFVVLSQSGRIGAELLRDGHQVIFFNSSVRIPNLKLIQKLVFFFRDQAPDVVHTSGAEANFHGLIAAWFAGVPTIIGEEIGLPNHNWKWRMIFKRVYALATKVIAISESVKNRIVVLGEVNTEKVEVVYNPVSFDGLEFSELGIENRDPDNYRGRTETGEQETEIKKKERFIFVTTCRLVPIKNLDRLVQAFAGLVKENAEKEILLRIVGDGSERKKLENLAREQGIANRIDFLGFQENVRPFLEAADAFVLPSFSEGFSISLVEAMLCSLPCIVTNQGGPAEIVEHGKTGFLIDPLNVNDLLFSMGNLLSLSPEKRKSIGQRAKNEAKRYSIHNYIQSLLKVYDFKP